MMKAKIIGAEKLNSGEMQKFMVEGKEILVANVDGILYAMDNTCTHMGGSLANGVLNGYTVKCPRHGAEYDLRTGECTGELTMFFVKMKTNGVKTYSIEKVDDVVTIEI